MPKLVKTAPAVRSHALYRRGAKPAQWQVRRDDGSVLFEVRGKTFDDGRTTYNLYLPGAATPLHVGMTFQDVRALVRAL